MCGAKAPVPGEFITRQVHMDNKTRQMVEGGFRRGILKTNVNNIERIMSRATDSKGRVHYGEAGRQLLRRQKEAQAYHERNK